MKIAVCVVTNRPECTSWLRWNLRKQTRSPDYLVVVHSPEVNPVDLWCEDPEALFMEVGGGCLGDRRNQALQILRAQDVLSDFDVITWFDDDDWYHPDWLRYLEKVFFPNWVKVAFYSSRHRFYLHEMKLADIEECAGIPALPAMGCRWGIGKKHHFDAEDRHEEQGWIDGVLYDAVGPNPSFPLQRLDEFPFIHYRTVIHGRNTWSYHPEETLQTYEGYGLVQSIPSIAPRDASQPEWDETLRRLADLRKELSCTSPSV